MNRASIRALASPRRLAVHEAAPRQAREAALHQARDGFALYLRMSAARVRSQMQYRASFLLETLAVFIGTFTDFIAILVLFGRFDRLGGWSLAEVALLYGMVATSFSLAQVPGAGFEEFDEFVRRGTFDGVLVRPRSATLQVMASQMPLRRAGRIAQAVLVLSLALAWLDAGSTWEPARWAFLIWSIAGGILFFLGLFMVRAAFCFWSVESLEAVNLVTYGGHEMASYPMHIFGDSLRRVFVYLIPLAFVNYYPALFLLGRSDPLGGAPWRPLLAMPLCALTCLAGWLVWSLGIRHYQSTGS